MALRLHCTTTDEHLLIALLQSRDRDAFALLYDTYAGAIYRAILKIVRHDTLAEEVLEETFVTVWRVSGSYDASKGRLFIWLAAVACNTALDMIKSKGHHDFMMYDSLEDLLCVVDRQVCYNTNTDTVGLVDIIGTLKVEHEQILNMIYFQGYTQQQAAKAMRIPLGTVKSRLRAAMNVLRRFYTTVAAHG